MWAWKLLTFMYRFYVCQKSEGLTSVLLCIYIVDMEFYLHGLIMLLKICLSFMSVMK